MTDRIVKIARAIYGRDDWDEIKDSVYASYPTQKHYLEMANRVATALASEGQPSPAQGVPEGWKLVPFEPTSNMINATREAYVAWETNDEGGPVQKLGARMYRAMLAAAPAPVSSAD